MELADWVESYRRAWEQNDAHLLVTLFTEDCSYRSSPFREPHLGPRLEEPGGDLDPGVRIDPAPPRPGDRLLALERQP